MSAEEVIERSLLAQCCEGSAVSVLEALRSSGYVVAPLDDLVAHVAASIRADLLIAPDELFTEAKTTAASGIQSALDYQ